MAEAIQLLVLTVFLRSYVLAFLAFSLMAAAVAIRWRWTALFTGIAWMVFARYRQWGVAYSFVGRGVPA
ncbi:MAG: hypothetical protein F9K13_00605 [Candidatus Methylomirabilis oxygeniifera]|uniref:Uncharacterized protein n=1 Tax=Methylomirabilis oxygeniifera TaxID=671143 RepID=D5MHN8_METO1|nr:MAG: hypothetical protein F9K13_00605 [Candidatus Methylomirabilis oxyfera]CBE67171.1 exported protein of unknown function [Candidatus Methylomirabilis oxyfera]